MREKENYCKQTWEIKSDMKNLYSGRLLKVFSKSTAHCWTLIIFSSKVINFKHIAQASTIAELFIKVQIRFSQSLGFKVRDSKPLIVNPFGVCDFIDLILSFPILTLLVCHSFFIDYLRNSRIGVFISDTLYFLASHSASSSLPRQSFLLMMSSNCQLFYLSW